MASVLVKQPEELLRKVAGMLPASEMAILRGTTSVMEKSTAAELVRVQKSLYGLVLPLTSNYTENAALLAEFHLPLIDLTAEERVAWEAALASLNAVPSLEEYTKRKAEHRSSLLSRWNQLRAASRDNPTGSFSPEERQLVQYWRMSHVETYAGYALDYIRYSAESVFQAALCSEDFLTCLRAFVVDPYRFQQRARPDSTEVTVATVAVRRYFQTIGLREPSGDLPYGKKVHNPRDYLLCILARFAEYRESREAAAWSMDLIRFNTYQQEKEISLHPEIVQLLSMTGLSFVGDQEKMTKWYRLRYRRAPPRHFQSEPPGTMICSSAAGNAPAKWRQPVKSEDTQRAILSLGIVIDRLVVQNQLQPALLCGLSPWPDDDSTPPLRFDWFLGEFKENGEWDSASPLLRLGLSRWVAEYLEERAPGCDPRIPLVLALTR